MHSSTGLFKRAVVGVGAATALAGASLLGLPGISAAAGVADLPDAFRPAVTPAAAPLGSADRAIFSVELGSVTALELFGIDAGLFGSYAMPLVFIFDQEVAGILETGSAALKPAAG